MSEKVNLDKVTLLDLFSEKELQNKQDLFSKAMGVASVITMPDGIPVTNPSNFCRLCMDIIRKTEKGRINCIKSDAKLGQFKPEGPIISPCYSGGLWDAGVSISVGNKQFGKWLIGQVKNDKLSYDKIKGYAREIETDETAFMEALDEVPEMPLEKFENIANMLFVFVNELTAKAYANFLLKAEMQEKEVIRHKLEENQVKLREKEIKYLQQNQDYLVLNEELKQTNNELLSTLEKLRKSQIALKEQNDQYLAINEELNQTNEKFMLLNEELNQKNEEYLTLNEEIKITNVQLQSALQNLKDSNNRNESLLQAIPDLIFVFSYDDVFIDCHIPKNATLLHQPSFFINQKVQHVMPTPVVEIHEKARKALIESGKPQNYQYSIEIDNELLHFESAMVKLGEDKILAIVRDNTQLVKSKQLEQEITITRKSAEFKQKFLANMSHEIRTPLTGMMGLAEILSKTRLDEDQRMYVENLRQSGENLRHIINLILDYSKIESGQMKIKLAAFRTNEIFEAASALYTTIAPKNVEFITSVDPRIPQYIETDINRLNQILNNLISNAVKFTRQGSITISANLHNIDTKENNCIVKIEIVDTGVGIDPGMQQYLFKPFSQIETNQQRTIEGTGLGLSICKELTTMLGGEIGVESILGKGSKFWFTFKAGLVKEIVTTKKREIINGSARNHKSNLSILLVEDKKVNQLVVSLMLKELGHKVYIAENGLHALEIYPQKHFDLILMDIQMPVMDGIVATNRLKSEYVKLPPIVGLSANAFEGDREKYMGMGLDEYLTKPVKTDDFNQMISRLFN